MPSSDSGKRIKRIERLLEISRDFGTSLELDPLLQSVASAACELTESQISTILMYEEETDLLKFVAWLPPEKEALKRLRVPLEKSLAGRVYTQSRPIISENASNDPRIFRELERALGVKIRSVMAVPMIFRSETIGVIETINKRDNTHYTEEDVTILENLSSHASVSILSMLMLDETKRAFKDLEELEKMKTDFIAIASHELRTPLGLILGHATDIRERVTDATQRQQLDVILRSAARLKKIIEDLSNVNSVQTGNTRIRHRTIKVGELIQEVVSGFMENARSKKISLVTEVPKCELEVAGDPEKLSLALSNVIENALAFTDSKGHILVAAEKLPGYVKVSVIDDGVGIPARDLPKVFDRFFQVESHLTRKHGGMGLGLSVAKAMVEMHDGQIWVESIEGKGSSFSILLPVKREREKTIPLALRELPKTRPFE
ncbi:MAG: GAF domain-containing protein [Chloroflexota bacterium]|nr:MAG: GAF domain-containing protein [Chloroflexota bacterium]